MNDQSNDGWDSPEVVKALKRDYRAAQRRAAGALLFGILFGCAALVIVVGSINAGAYSAIIVGLAFAAISAYLLYSARDHFKSL